MKPKAAEALAILLCISAGLYGAHWFSNQPPAITEEPSAVSPFVAPAITGGNQEAELEKNNETPAGTVKDTDDRLAAAQKLAAQWEAEAGKLKTGLDVMVKDRDDWEKNALQWEKLANEQAASSRHWQSLAGDLTAERDQWQAFAKQQSALADQNYAAAISWQKAAGQKQNAVPWSAFDKFEQRRAAIDAAKVAKASATTTAAEKAAALQLHMQMTRDAMAADAAYTQERQLNKIDRSLRR